MVLDWIFEGMVKWVSSIVTQLMDAVSGLFLNALGTEMTAMEEYFPFVAKAFTILQYTSWTILFLITVWQLFRAFGGPISEAENPTTLVLRSALFAVLIYFAKPIFLYVLRIATAPYTALLNLPMTSEDFTFAGIEGTLKSGLASIIGVASVVGLILIIILMVTLGWNYFKLLLEVVERYIVVGVLCYTSPLAYSMGASKATNQVFKSWCRMIGSQLLLLIMNVWFLRAFNSSVGHYMGNGGALSNGHGSIFLWLFCAIAFLKVAQRFDAYLASIGLNVAQTGSGLGMELLVATRLISGMASGGFRSAGGVFGTGVASTAVAAGGGFANKFKGNSYVRDAVVQGGSRMGAGGAVGFVGRAFGGIAARNGATLTGNSISSVANAPPNASGTISGDIADRSLSNYMPHLSGHKLNGTQITGGQINAKAIDSAGKETELSMFNASQFEKPSDSHSVVTASDGSQWYQMATGEGAGSFNDAPHFTGSIDEASMVSNIFPSAESGTVLRSVDSGVLEATTADGNSLWYNSAYYEEPDAPHSIINSANGMEWYAMDGNAAVPQFEAGAEATAFNNAQFNSFMPGYEQPISYVDVSNSSNGRIEVRHDDGSGTMFYDATQYVQPHGEYKTYEDANGNSWYAIHGESIVERKPLFENGKPVYDGDNVQTVSRASVKYSNTPSQYDAPKTRNSSPARTPRRKK